MDGWATGVARATKRPICRLNEFLVLGKFSLTFFLVLVDYRIADAKAEADYVGG